MSTTRTRLTARYLAGLRVHLSGKHAANGQARALGRAMLARGLAALDLAVMHEQAIVALAPAQNFANTGNGALRRAGAFFTQALIPLEAAQRATRETVSHLHRRNEDLHRSSIALLKANRRQAREVARRKTAETALRKGKEQYRTLFLESRVMQKKLRRLTRQIISAQEDERKEISRELHDGVVQTLVGINVELSTLGRGAALGLGQLRQRIAHTQRLVEKSVNAVHRFARELRPAVLDDLGLIPALHAYSKSLAARKKIKIQMTAFGGVEALGSAKRIALFRVAQEALTNIARHARASQVHMSITQIAGAIRLEISDNGKSFHVGRTLFARNNRRLGLIGMRERIEMVGGRLTIESARGIGTTVRAEIPFTKNQKKP